MSNLAYLHLQNDGFIGVFPDAMFNLPVLKVMDISGNYLSGNIPDYFPRFPHLAILLLARNRFHGIIPVSLCKVQKLQILDMSANLLSGVLPSCLGNITTWIKESGVILHSFMWLSPSYTNYRVKVPLTTKGNALSYEGIPLSQMTTLDLSMNRLTGRIPFENKFVTFAASSYRGNKELCGLPLEKDCVVPRPPQQHEEEEEEEKERIGESDFFFFSCIAVAYVVGFWSVIAPLLLSRNWRRSYYAKVDTCIELCKEKLHLF
ncbi:receptor-like protein EIX2 [Nicotiana tomentosiformis]|uniref:receptor-like protein EIX2 n=1 Tax=Nicotiana tomentosiformis TaxID=4098 RepID=UPI00051AB35D|nr:receptor-like protein EIX2 [Nicotiana tomentosiformis]